MSWVEIFPAFPSFEESFSVRGGSESVLERYLVSCLVLIMVLIILHFAPLARLLLLQSEQLRNTSPSEAYLAKHCARAY